MNLQVSKIMRPKNKQLIAVVAVSGLLLSAQDALAAIQVAIGHNSGELESGGFTFTNVPPPSRNDAATSATFTLLSGAADGNAASLKNLHDGKLPVRADEPAANFFLAAGSSGGRIEIDLGRVVDIRQINTYSCHPSTRSPQVYSVYGGDEAAAGFVATPDGGTDLEKSGWKLIAPVDSRLQTTDGGQCGVSISDSAATVGKFRHLLFAMKPTETEDDFGNTFYSEIDVVELNAPVEVISAAKLPPLVVHAADNDAEITIDTSKSPELGEWAEQKLAPALVEWYPKIAAMLSSDGFGAPKKFSVTIRPGNGVAFTSGNRIVVNSKWLAGELNGEAVGAIIHEAVHVVQQYGNGWRDGQPAPGWLQEGIPDYLRFFKFEPQTHGADIVWLRARPRMKINYDGMYRISANFLDYVVGHYDHSQSVIKKVNAACRAGSYTDGLWQELTGKTLAELNEAWQASVHQQLEEKSQ